MFNLTLFMGMYYVKKLNHVKIFYILTVSMKYVMIATHAFIVCIKMSKNSSLPTSATSEVNEIIWSVTGMNMKVRDPRVNKSFHNIMFVFVNSLVQCLFVKLSFVGSSSDQSVDRDGSAGEGRVSFFSFPSLDDKKTCKNNA